MESLDEAPLTAPGHYFQGQFSFYYVLISYTKLGYSSTYTGCIKWRVHYCFFN